MDIVSYNEINNLHFVINDHDCIYDRLLLIIELVFVFVKLNKDSQYVSKHMKYRVWWLHNESVL